MHQSITPGDIFVIIIGIIGMFVWGYAIFCIFYKQIVVDRILSRSKYWYMVVILCIIALLPFSITTVAYFNNVQPYDILFYNNLYGTGTDLEQKVEYKAEIQRKITEQAEDPSLLGTIFFHFRGIGGQYASGTPRGRVWAIWIGIIGTLLFSGFMIPTMTGIMRKRSDDWQWGEVRYNIQRSRYAVILGAHEAVPALIRQLLSRKEDPLKYVIVQTTNNVYYYRLELQRELTEAEEWNTILYNGGRGTLADMEQLHLERASEVYLLGESSQREWEDDHDSQNMLCLRNIATILKTKHRKTRMKCFIMFDFQSTFASFRYSDLNDVVRQQIEFVALNIHQMWAQNVLVKRQSKDSNELSYLPLEGNNCIDRNSKKYVHLIVVGMNKSGVSIAEEACQICHYPNFETQGRRTRFTFIDPSADREMTLFINSHAELFKVCRHRYVDSGQPDFITTAWTDPMREGPYKHLGNNRTSDDPERDSSFIDFEWEFVRGKIESNEIQSYLVDAVSNPDAIVTVAVCMEQTQTAMNSAIFMPREVFRNAIQVLVLQKHSSDLIANLSGIGKSDEQRHKMRYNIIRPFGMNSDVFAKDSVVDYRLAKLVNYVYNDVDDTKLEHINDIDKESGLTLQDLYWRRCTVADQWSSNYNANSIPTKLRYLGLDFETSSIEEIDERLNEPGMMEMLVHVEHNRWNTEKLLTGFRPLNSQELTEFDDLLAKKAEYKDLKARKKFYQQGWEMAHLDILSFKDLEVYDAPSIVYDEILTRALPYIVLRWRDAVNMQKQVG
ncbi:MAG: hypothetical protein KBT20_03625 [Bacteroidales bacterium]|nr:hypothetical protein [Candidatus Liminaster caballi]